MTDNSTAPHILIEGRPDLTKRLWDQCDVKPLVLTARVASSPIYFATRDAIDASPDAEPSIYSFSGTALLPGMEEYYPQIVRETKRALADLVSLARARFGLGPGEEVRIAVAGSQGSLWLREHANVAMPGCLYPEEQNEADEAWAFRLLGRSAQNRAFVRHLQTALQNLEGARLVWLAKAFPDLREKSSPHEGFRDLAAKARTTLATDPAFRDVKGAAPLLYTRDGPGDWVRFTKIWSKDGKDADRGRNPFLTTSQLIQQYRDYHAREGLECVLVKVIANAEAANPCDNPIITTAHLQQARDAGISAILLDDEHGVADLIVEGQDFVDGFVEWQREELRKTLQETEPLKKTYRNLAAAERYFLDRFQEMYDLWNDVGNDVDAGGLAATVDPSTFNPFGKLRKDFRPFRASAESAPGKPDPADGDRPPPAPRALDQVPDDTLVREIITALEDIAGEVERDVLKRPVNAQVALKVIDSVRCDLAQVVTYIQALMGRVEARRGNALARILIRAGWLRRLWIRVTGRVGTDDAPPEGWIPTSANAFLRAMQVIAGLQRTLDAADAQLPARLASYEGRQAYPPIYRV